MNYIILAVIILFVICLIKILSKIDFLERAKSFPCSKCGETFYCEHRDSWLLRMSNAQSLHKNSIKKPVYIFIFVLLILLLCKCTI